MWVSNLFTGMSSYCRSHKLTFFACLSLEDSLHRRLSAPAHTTHTTYRRRPARPASGIVQSKGTVRRIDRASDMCSFEIQLPAGAGAGVQIGASVAINGTCLTVVAEPAADLLRFDVIAESLRRTNLGDLQEGSAVNFERSARMGDEIGGHSVSGHVHTVATLSSVTQAGNDKRLEFSLRDPEWSKYILAKGYVSVDGCSLTVGEVVRGESGGDASFSVYLIPETLRVTVFGERKKGDQVNVEVEAQTQAVVDTVERVLPQYLESYLAARGR
jgi:riboflavin synthase